MSMMLFLVLLAVLLVGGALIWWWYDRRRSHAVSADSDRRDVRPSPSRDRPDAQGD